MYEGAHYGEHYQKLSWNRDTLRLGEILYHKQSSRKQIVAVEYCQDIPCSCQVNLCQLIYEWEQLDL